MIEEYLNKIISGDALEVMKELPNNSIHLIVTSPPYNVGMNYKQSDDRKPYLEYLKFLEGVFRECYRVLIRGGRIAVNCPATVLQSASSKMAYLSLDICLMLRKIGFLDREWVCWIKGPRGEILGKSTSWGSWRSPSCPYTRDASEFIIVMDKETHKREDKKGMNDIAAEEFLLYSSNCWYFPPETRKLHPAPFPEELPLRLIKFYTWKDDIVLDPFVGSGTTAVVAKKLGRRFIGIDISEEYCRMARERVVNGTRSLFETVMEVEK